ncbi:SigE family RNA polymerase sigma factor [Actinocrinis sp.]|uniref:SigE family RNA polymerase sigma factor n=1 Tax=Actinocrinis sp. TaxID=1920516 RepID=UPI002B78F0AA|nr:SigE family RNA polymerase sigma factor [Actinocrinis sp.]HXR70529.1 SigE family RNA polymerase sigma factor [Actinocrinis sp.]
MRNRGVEDGLEEFAEFYQTSRDGCLRAVYASVGDRLLAEELVAEAYARAWASWRKVSRHPAPPAWVVRTALNTHVSWWRRRRREVSWESRGSTDTPLPTTQAASSVDEQVLAAVRSLPLRQREVIALRVFLDLDTETTARTLAIAPGTVTAHLSRAIAALRDRLASSVEEETRSR